MTRLFTEGAEMGDILFWDSYNSVAVESSTPAISPYYYRHTNYVLKYFTSTDEFYFRTRTRASRIRSDEYFIQFRSGGNTIFWVNGGGTVWNTSSGITTTSIFANTWYVIEIYFKLANSGGRLVLKIDGNMALDFTGDTNPGSYTTLDNFYSLMYDGQSAYFDDLAMNDTNNSDGKNDNSWCSDGYIIKMTPSGSSATTNNWFNSGSVSGSANYLYVDEYPKDDDTTYVYASGSDTGRQDQYAMSDLSLGNKRILRIWTEARAKKTLADETYVKVGYLPSGGTDSVSGSKALTLSYARVLGDEAKTNPYTSASWTNGDVNALEAVIEMG